MGIGTDKPDVSLEIATTNPTIRLNGNSDGAFVYADVQANAGHFKFRSRAGSVNPGFYTFYNYDGTTENLALRITSTGNVGVNHAEPDTLTVQADADLKALRVVGRASDHRGTLQFVDDLQGTITGSIQADDNYLKIRGNSSLAADSIHILLTEVSVIGTSAPSGKAADY